MTERFLVVRSAATNRYFILGTDFPCARVFDSTASSLVATLQPPNSSQTFLHPDSLTSVAIGVCSAPQRNDVNADSTARDVEMTFAAAGLSNGKVILHHVEGNKALGQVLVSPTQQPVVHMSICSGCLWCLSEDNKVSLVRLDRPEEGVCFQFSSLSSCSSLAVVQREVGGAEERKFDVLVVGSVTTMYTITVYGGTASKKNQEERFQCEKGVSFASQGAAASFAWLSPYPLQNGSGKNSFRKQGRAAVTASPQDATIRVWDVVSEKHISADANLTEERTSALSARCRRTLMCGQRIADVSVLEGSTSCFIAATTFTGAVLIWDLGSVLLPPIAESVALSPDMVLSSSLPLGRLLMCRLLPFHDKEEKMDSLSLLLMRGRFALPRFETAIVRSFPSLVDTVAKPQQHRFRVALLSSLSISASASVVVKEVPLSDGFRASLELQETMLRRHESRARSGGEAGAFDALDQLWAKQHVVAVATASNLMPAEAFPMTRVYRAPSTADLPVKQMTLEQRIREVAKQPGRDLSSDVAAKGLGLATVPLYQALHANDVSAVMELLSVASRSPEGVRATVVNLQLPYCLQLLRVISERLGICSGSSAVGAHSSTAAVVGGGLGSVSSRAPLLEWIDAIIHYRGVELYEAQLAYDRQGAQALSSSTTTDEASTLPTVSPPKDFIAPILHQYRRMTSMYDTLATLHGRMGVFLGVRPSEKNRFINRSRKMLSSNWEIGRESVETGMTKSDIIFPAMFAEVASRKKGNYTIRVRSKAAISLARRKKRTTDEALLREAERLAAESAKRQPKSILDDEDETVWDDAIMETMGDENGELNLDQLDNLNIDDDSDEELEEELLDESEMLVRSDEDDGETENKSSTKRSKRMRHETAEMLANQNSEDESDQEDGSEKEDFSEGSDEDLRSSSESADEEDSDISSENEMESTSEEYLGGDQLPSDEEPPSEESDDGMDEDMAQLLEENGVSAKANKRDKKMKVD